MRPLPQWLAAGLLAFSGTLAGCGCNGHECDTCPTGVDDVQVAFATDSTRTGFSIPELRGAYLVRYRRPGFARVRDTLRRLPAPTPENTYGSYRVSLRYATTAPTQYTHRADTLVAYNYRVVLPVAGRQYDLSDLEVNTRNSGGCCDCAFNERRRLWLDGQLVIADGRDGPAVFLRK